MDLTIFEKIIAGEIPCKKVYEDAHTFSFYDVSPQAPVHVLVLPKKKFVNLTDATDSDAETLGQLLLAAKKVAELTGIDESGYRLVINNGEGVGQSVFYMHCHVLGGRDFSWPPG